MRFVLPAPGEIHVRRFDLDRENAQLGFLSQGELVRAARFHLEREARRWASGRSLLRRALGAYLGASPESLRFETGLWGKLGLPNCPLRFNVSHSGPVLLLAFAWRQEVGIDIERVRSDFAPEELAAQVFSEAEQVWLDDCPPARRHSAFLTLWTAKEAYVKAGGKGLSFPLTQLTLMPISESDRFYVQDLTTDGSRPNISICRLAFGPDLCAALAAEGALTRISYFEPCHDDSN